MSSPKGYSSQEKNDYLTAQHTTVEPVRGKQFALSVASHNAIQFVGVDTAETGSTVSVINATSHVARKGDVITIISGSASIREVKVFDVATNTITLAEALSVAPSNGDKFVIHRNVYERIGSVVDFIDGASGVLDTSSTNIPGSGSSQVTLVTNLAAPCTKISVVSTIAAGLIGIYTGAAASEVLAAVIHTTGNNTIDVNLPGNARISAKRLDSATAISSGFLAINFIG